MKNPDNKTSICCKRDAGIDLAKADRKQDDKSTSAEANTVKTSDSKPKPWSVYKDWYWI